MAQNHFDHFIDGKYTVSTSDRFDTLDPSTGQLLGRVARGSEADVDEAATSAARAFENPSWRRMAVADRGRLLMAVAAAIRSHATELARLESTDVGKPLAQAENDVRSAARYFEYYGGMADKVLGDVIPVRWGVLDMALHEPFGVCAQIIPWNFPLAMGARGIAPALASGNTVVAKPAEQASLSILKLAELAGEAGVPAGVFNVVCGLGQEAGASLTRHSAIRHITFTGSVATGTTVMKAAADGIRTVALELGGKSPVVVFADADLDAAADMIVRSLIVNAGQTCNACTRLLVEERVRVELLDKVRGRLGNLRLGSPFDSPDVGPLITSEQREKVRHHLALAEQDGGLVSRFGALPSDAKLAAGFYQQPALIEKLDHSHPLFHEEIFGPVLAVVGFADAEEAVALANDSEYGLVAAIWTRDVARAMEMANRVEAGQIYINGWGTGGGVEVPFGGYKKSGIGREKGIEGFMHYMQTKSVSIYY